MQENKKCTIDGCIYPYYAKGMCNGHYIRNKKGKNLDSKIKIRNQQGCSINNCQNDHYGKGLCEKHYKRSVKDALRTEIIELKGGKCGICNGVFHYSCYDFHHLNAKEKEYSVSDLIRGMYNKDLLLKEIDKCILLCSNCHRKLHAENRNDKSLRKQYRTSRKFVILNKKYKKVNNEDVDGMKKLWQKGHSLASIGKIYNISYQYVSALINGRKKRNYRPEINL